MKQLYFPTTTLNFNNILSSESISPRTFYGARGYGFHSWYSLSLGESENVLLLYEEPFRFERPASDSEDHPLLISLQVDEGLLTPAGEGRWLCDHTIYLSPWRTRFILFSERDKRTMLSISEYSLETKMVKLYQKSRIEVRSYMRTYQPESEVPSNVVLNEEALKRDIRTNKLKGLLYGYYIGASLSVPSALVAEQNRLRELKNIFSSIASSPDRRPKPIQDKRLDELIQEINDETPAFVAMERYMSDKNIPDVYHWIRDHWIPSFDILVPGMLSKAHLLNSIADRTEYTRTWLSDKDMEIEQERRNSRHLLHPEAEEIILSDGKVNTIKAAGPDEALVKLWINEVLCDGNYSSEVGQYCDEPAKTLTDRAKDFFGDKWEDSTVKERLSAMCRFVLGQEQMETWDNGAISSIAAVLSKGEDWEKLLKFMRSKGMNDYRLAFAFYGLLHGFANLTRDFTDLLLDNDRSYVADVLKEFNGQLLGDDLAEEATFEGSATLEAPTIGENLPDQEVTPLLTNQQGMKEVSQSICEQEHNSIYNFLKIADILMPNRANGKKYKAFEDLKQYLINRSPSCETGYTSEELCKVVHEGFNPKRLKNKEQREESLKRIDLCLELEKNSGNPQTFLQILAGCSYLSQKEKEEVNRLVQKGAPQQSPKPTQGEIPFDPQIVKGEEFLTDSSWIEETEKMIPNISSRDAYHRDVVYFVGGYNNVGGSCAQSDRNNKSVIDHFERYLYRNKMPENVRKKYKNIDIKEIILHIRRRYGC